MRTYTRRTDIPVPREELFAWHARPGAFRRLTPPWAPVRLEKFEGIEDGNRAVLNLGRAGIPLRWVAEHRDYEEGRQFRDIQVSGPFAAWRHTHRMLPHDYRSDESSLEDHVEYELPLAPISTALAHGLAEREIERMFAYRHRITREDLRRHRESNAAPMTVAVTGSTGMIGDALCAFLTTGGHNVVRLVRSRKAVVELNRSMVERAAFWDPSRAYIDPDAFHGVDAVVHLAGEPLSGGVWSRSHRARILDTRARGTRALARTLASLPEPPKILLSASGSHYYGDRGHERLTELSGPGEGFLADVCRSWEAATEPAEDAGIRVCHMRIGAVLSPDGGLLQAIGPVFNLGLGGRVGRGTDWFSWIALDDVLYAMLHLLCHDDLSGPFNLCAPQPISQHHFISALGEAMRRPTVLRVPRVAARLIGGEFAAETVLASTRVVPERLANSGYRFAYSTIDDALAHVLGRSIQVPTESPI